MTKVFEVNAGPRTWRGTADSIIAAIEQACTEMGITLQEVTLAHQVGWGS